MSNGLDVALMNDPFGEWSPTSGDRHLRIAFSDPEWGSFFFGSLGAPEPRHIEGEQYVSYDARRRSEFRAALKAYPLLARIDEFYQDACFAQHEISALGAELERAASLPMTDEARAFWKGMCSACDEAQAAGLGIRLLSS